MQGDNLIFQGDCLDVIKELIAQDMQVDSIVTDPPYEIGFMGKGWDKTGIAYNKELWELCLKILKPGGHLLAFGGSRTYHRMASAIEDAGFEIRDQIMWLYGSGFPKSLDVSKAIDKAAGVEREVIGSRMEHDIRNNNPMESCQGENKERRTYHFTAPATDTAKEWDGWGSALKPAHEPIVMARKPLAEPTIAANVLKHGTGAINIDGCRVVADSEYHNGYHNDETKIQGSVYGWANSDKYVRCEPNKEGRFPANLIHDGSEEVESEFAKYGDKGGGFGVNTGKPKNAYGKYKGLSGETIGYGDNGTASRFFYCAKASKKERNGSKHPTVKPLALMRYLCRLITPPGGLILDPFAGTGTTGRAAIKEGFRAVLIEKEADYIHDIKRESINA